MPSMYLRTAHSRNLDCEKEKHGPFLATYGGHNAGPF